MTRAPILLTAIAGKIAIGWGALALTLLAAAGPSQAALPAISIVKAELDFSAAPGTGPADKTRDFLGMFKTEARVIYLDLTIFPALTGGDTLGIPDFKLRASDATGAETPIDCAPGGSQMLDGKIARLDFLTGDIYAHLVLEAMIASGPAAPYQSLACDYAPGAKAGVALRLTGFFVVQPYAIPTANGARLVPVTPELAMAAPALAKAAASR